jgi:uncharacterized protein
VGNRRAVLIALSCLVAGPAMAACRADQVEVRTPGGAVMRFAVEVADDPGERAQGLMHRERMAMSAGMLFVYERPQAASFWMKNTRIPLDMVFADPSGTVTRVHARAIPGDTTQINGGNGVKLVLEINGGLAGRMGIAPGAVLRHPAVAQGGAAWPCD